MGDWRRVLPAVARLLDDGAAEGLHSGAQGYVSLSGEPVCDIVMGEVSPGSPMAADMLMPWLSCSKPVAAVALGQLWERDLLDLDDPVARFVPEFAAAGKDSITLRHILTHTAGLRLFEQKPHQLDENQVIPSICQSPQEPEWIPGKKAGYHKFTSWYILGEVIRRIDGREYASYARDMIFQPLGMDDCWLSMGERELSRYGTRVAVLYDTSKRPPAPGTDSRPERLRRCSPGSSGRGPMRQLGRFFEMLLFKGSAGSTRIVSPPVVEALVARHRTGMFDHTFRHELDWGLGFILESSRHGPESVPYGYGRHASPRTFGHGGSQSSVGFCDPEHQLVVTLVLNGMPGEPRHQRRMRALLTALYEDLELEKGAGTNSGGGN